MSNSLTSEAIYQQIGTLLASVPNLTDFDDKWRLPPDTMKWLSRASALVRARGLTGDSVKLDHAIEKLVATYSTEQNARAIVMILGRVLASVELELPAQSQGAFVQAGSEFDAIAAFGKVLSGAQSDVLIIDPYMDERALTDFAVLIPEGKPVRLLTDEASMKAGLRPMAERWIAQYGKERPLSLRTTAPRSLHDRLLIVDNADAWILTQSLKDFAKRSPASLQRTGVDVAEMKVTAYNQIWSLAAETVAS